MPDIVKTVKLHIHPDKDGRDQLAALTGRYAQACTYVSEYVFHHGFILNFMKLQDALYQTVRWNGCRNRPCSAAHRQTWCAGVITVLWKGTGKTSFL